MFLWQYTYNLQLSEGNTKADTHNSYFSYIIIMYTLILLSI